MTEQNPTAPGGRASGQVGEHAVVDVLAYLVCAARTQIDEAAEYAPMRLLTAARKLAEHVAPHASAPTRALLEALETMPLIATPTADRDLYVARLDAICIQVAECLLALSDRASS